MVVRRLLATLVAASLLVSCSDDGPRADPPEPTAPATSATVEPSATVTPTGLEVPPEARGTDEASAKAFVKYWFKVLSQSMSDGQVRSVLDLSDPRCKSCKDLTAAIAEVYAEGGRFKTTGWHVELIAHAPAYTKSKPDYLLRTRHARRTLVGASGTVVDVNRQETVAMRVVLTRVQDGWRVRVLEQVR